MPTNDFWSESGQLILEQIAQAMRTVITQKAHLNASELRQLDMLASQLWSYINAERNPTMADTADSPVWSAISQLGIVVYPETVSFRGRDVTLWGWSIPKYQIRLGQGAGYDTQIDALRAALQVYFFPFHIVQREHEAMVEADLATFQTWKALKKRAGTWMYPYNPTHRDEQGASTQEGFTREDGPTQ